MLLGKPSDGPRWPRGQKFTLTPAGIDADGAYRTAVLEARGAGRSGLETALGAWAAPLAVAPGDGVILGELRGKARGLAEVTRSLEDAGIAAAEVRQGLGRLVAAGLVLPVPLASQQDREPQTPPSRW